jgi:hypothetical protein
MKVPEVEPASDELGAPPFPPAPAFSGGSVAHPATKSAKPIFKTECVEGKTVMPNNVP